MQAVLKQLMKLELKNLLLQLMHLSLQIKNGWLVRGDEILTGKRQGVQWWSGGLQAFRY